MRNLDKFWCTQDVYYNYKVTIARTENAFIYITFNSPRYSGRQNIQTINTTKQTNEQIEKYMNGSNFLIKFFLGSSSCSLGNLKFKLTDTREQYLYHL